MPAPGESLLEASSAGSDRTQPPADARQSRKRQRLWRLPAFARGGDPAMVC